MRLITNRKDNSCITNIKITYNWPIHLFFQPGLIPFNNKDVEGMTLQNKEEDKVENYIGKLISKEPKDKWCLVMSELVRP